MTDETGPFFFAWVEPTDTTFGIEHQVCDEFLYSVEIEHTEDDIPIMTVTMENPGGLLAPGRKRWVWFSWRDEEGHVWPLFFGSIVGVPKGLIGQDVTVQFSAKPLDYYVQQLYIASALRKRPYWDPVFIDPTERYKPESVLAAYPQLWHVDRITGVVTTSDLLVGEDGVEIFEEGEVPYDSVDFGVDQAPLSIVNVDASVPWTQRESGVRGIIAFNGGVGGLYDPASVVSSWPKEGASLGNGWTVYSSSAKGGGTANSSSPPASTLNPVNQIDPNNNQFITSSGPSSDPYSMITEQYSFEDRSAKHQIGDTINMTMSYTHPKFITGGPVEFTNGQTTVKSIQRVYAYISPDPDFLDQPTSSVNIQYEWNIAQIDLSQTQHGAADLTLVGKYDMSIQRSERVLMSVTAAVQPVFADMEVPGGFPGGTPDYEELTLTGADVGQPLVDAQMWRDVSNSPVTVGEYCRSDDLKSLFVSLSDGLTGTTEPIWNRTVGATTTDGMVTWACVDSIAFNALPWSPDAQSLAGTIIRVLEATETTFEEHWHLATSGGVTGLAQPGFTNVAGSTQTDGTVVWRSLGPTIPTLAPPIGSAARPSYFPTDRGRWSIEYLIARSRARLIFKSRVGLAAFDCGWKRGIHLSCRKSAVLHDSRIPGGAATGKIVYYRLSCDLQSKVMNCNVKLGCAVGYGTSIAAGDPGEPVYIDSDYIEDDYQEFSGEIISLPEAGDISYTPPIGTGYTPSPSSAWRINDGAIDVTLGSVTGGPIETDYFIETSLLSIPMDVNLAAHA